MERTTEVTKTLFSAIILFAVLASASYATAQTSTITDLGSLGGTSSEAFAINAVGQVVGKAPTPQATNTPLSSRLVFIGRAGDLDSVFCEGKKLGSWDQVLQPFGAEVIVGDVPHCIAVKGNDVMKLEINLPPHRTQVGLAQRNPTKT